jgi:uncharacterized membrane protein YbaN (DUF454 family)
MKIFKIVIGSVSLGLGILGIFLPLLPTTPFLLLSAWLFAQSSKKLYKWLLENKIFGKYISDYTQNRGVPLRAKIISLVLLWGTILYSVFFVISEKWWLQALLLTIAVGVTIHLLRLKTRKKRNTFYLDCAKSKGIATNVPRGTIVETSAIQDVSKV